MEFKVLPLTLFLGRYSYSPDEISSYETSNLQFTGVSYHTVILVLDRESLVRLNEQSFLLYQAISRATYRAILICHEEDFDYIYKLLTPDEADRQVLNKLRESKDVRVEDFQLLTDKRQWGIALELVIVTKNIGVFEKIKNLIIRQLGYKAVLINLLEFFHWGEEGEIVRMIESLNPQAVLTADELLSSLFYASLRLWILPNEQKRRSLWQSLKQTSIISTFLSNTTDFCVFRIYLSLLWHDEELYQTTMRKVTSFFVACSHHLSQCFDALPSSMKEEMNCVPLIDGVELFLEYETARDKYFQENRGFLMLASPRCEDFFRSLSVSDLYTSTKEHFRSFFIRIWEEVSKDSYEVLIPHEKHPIPECIKMELLFINSFERICKQKTNEMGPTDLTVALQISYAVSKVRHEVFNTNSWNRSKIVIEDIRTSLVHDGSATLYSE